jgi:hypothetical protein
MHNVVFEAAHSGGVDAECIQNSEFDGLTNADCCNSNGTMVHPFINIGSGNSSGNSLNVTINNSTSSNGYGSPVPDISCPWGVCQLYNPFLQNIIETSIPVFALSPFPDQRILEETHPTTEFSNMVGLMAQFGVASSLDGFSGFGMTGNLLTCSDDLSCGWNPYNYGAGSVPVVVTGQTDPLGGTKAVQATFAIPSSPASLDTSAYYQVITGVSGQNYTFDMWAKACSGSQTFVLFAGGVGDEYTVTTAWQRVKTTWVGNSFFVGKSGNVGGPPNNGGTACVVLYGAQATPGIAIHPYVSTTTAAAPIQPRMVVNGQSVATSASVAAAIAAGGFLTTSTAASTYAPIFTGYTGTFIAGTVTCHVTNGVIMGCS